MQAKQDSIAQLNVQKDASILEFMSAMNEIQSNLDSIKTIEKIVSVQSSSGSEMKPDAKKRIIAEIAEINNLLQKQRAFKISSGKTSGFEHKECRIRENDSSIEQTSG